MLMEIVWQQTTAPKAKPDPNGLGFGRVFTDHMFVMDYNPEHGWHDPRIVPYGPLELEPSTVTLHYAQAVFEGMKAYRTADGRILLFRPRLNLERLNQSCDRLCIPPLDTEFVLRALKELLRIEQDWIPSAPGTSLYIRPFVFATDTILGVHPAQTYKFVIILSPVGSYYPEGINPVSIYVEPEHVRAVRGGTGQAKAAGNYAAGLKAQKAAKAGGHAQVLWLDALERRYVEEVGAMNVFFKIGGEVITPELGGTILPGITRRSVLELLRSWGVPTAERKLAIDEVFEAHAAGTLEEAFGSGTAAVISPIGRLAWRMQVIDINEGRIGELSKKLYDTLTGIQTGRLPDDFGWTEEV